MSETAITPDHTAAAPVSRGQARLFGMYGVSHKIMRDEYQRGLAHLTANTFESSQAREEWLSFVQDLKQDGLLDMMQDTTWT